MDRSHPLVYVYSPFTCVKGIILAIKVDFQGGTLGESKQNGRFRSELQEAFSP
jgi:hypothetical protein